MLGESTYILRVLIRYLFWNIGSCTTVGIAAKCNYGCPRVLPEFGTLHFSVLLMKQYRSISCM